MFMVKSYAVNSIIQPSLPVVVINKEYRKSNNDDNKIILYDTADEPILNIKEDKSIKGLKIYDKDNTFKLIATISLKSLIKGNKYVIDYINQHTNKREKLDLKCDFFGESCGIFYGHEKDKAPMICNVLHKRNKFSDNNDQYCVQMASNVDAALMIAVAICFDILKHKK
ncbi:hypothetical protein BCR32DRAFT_325070 [Anaeromyces robustus]|uniref:DUF567-domain-containing protein n=1 Tax=Anaeromyces robustus TaxID=1754192 RepID=A0A1Y1XK89_9FUNG|nr:hypothetical protein BCR32DRAFT_325070 [Anaeromyces robustus]|eukprot:ORX86177.1 hypothetical protein BCR32DRAFT_325070 [Anaeromyces robustus]